MLSVYSVRNKILIKTQRDMAQCLKMLKEAYYFNSFKLIANKHGFHSFQIINLKISKGLPKI